MNVDVSMRMGGQSVQTSTVPTSPGHDSGFGPSEYNVRTGIDVAAEGPGAATLAAIEEMALRNPEAFCFHVEHLQSGRKWEVELYPNGRIKIEESDA